MHEGARGREPALEEDVPCVKAHGRDPGGDAQKSGEALSQAIDSQKSSELARRIHTVGTPSVWH